MVGGFLGVGVAGESERGRLEIDFEGFVGDIGRRDRQENVIFLGVGGRGALSPED